MSMTLHQQTVNVDRRKLLTELRKNLKKHQATYKKAIEDYRLAIQLDLETALESARNPQVDIKSVNVKFQPPVSYEKEYIDAIDMLDMSVDPSIKLDRDAFKAYMKDEWNWKVGFDLSNSFYASKAVTSLSGRTGNATIKSADIGGLISEALPPTTAAAKTIKPQAVRIRRGGSVR